MSDAVAVEELAEMWLIVLCTLGIGALCALLALAITLLHEPGRG